MSRSHATATGSRPDYRVALSFAGAQRELVEAVAERLAERLGRDQIFYDRNYPADMGRFDLDLYLQPVYRDRSRLVVVFLSEDYGRSEWCRAEWLAIRELRNRGRSDQILLLRVADGQIRGLADTDVPVDVRDSEPGRIADLIHQRLRGLPAPSQETLAPESSTASSPRREQIEDEIRAGRKALAFGRSAFLAGVGLALAAVLLLSHPPELGIRLFGVDRTGTSLPADLSIACCLLGLAALLLQEKVRSTLYRLEFDHHLLFEDVSSRIGVPDVFRDHALLYKTLCLLVVTLQVIATFYSTVLERLASDDPLAGPFPYDLLLAASVLAGPYLLLFLRPITPEVKLLRWIRKGSSTMLRTFSLLFTNEEHQVFFRELFWLDDLARLLVESWARWTNRDLRQRGSLKHGFTFGLPMLVLYIRYSSTVEEGKGPGPGSASVARGASRSAQLCRPPANLLDDLDFRFRRLLLHRRQEAQQIFNYGPAPDEFLRKLARARATFNEQWRNLPDVASVYDWYCLFTGYFFEESPEAPVPPDESRGTVKIEPPFVRRDA